MECYCSNRLTFNAQDDLTGGCNMSCAGNSKQICGGSARMALYANEEWQAPYVPGPDPPQSSHSGPAKPTDVPPTTTVQQPSTIYVTVYPASSSAEIVTVYVTESTPKSTSHAHLSTAYVTVVKPFPSVVTSTVYEDLGRLTRLSIPYSGGKTHTVYVSEAAPIYTVVIPTRHTVTYTPPQSTLSPRTKVGKRQAVYVHGSSPSGKGETHTVYVHGSSPTHGGKTHTVTSHWHEPSYSEAGRTQTVVVIPTRHTVTYTPPLSSHSGKTEVDKTQTVYESLQPNASGSFVTIDGTLVPSPTTLVKRTVTGI